MIREAQIEDVGSLLKLLHQLSPPGEERAEMEHLRATLEEIIGDPNHHIFLLIDNGEAIGTGTLLIQPNLSHAGQPYAHIENVVVDGQHRGQGIGRKIMNRLVQTARERNCYKVILVCEEDNAPFYESCQLYRTGEVEMRKDLGRDSA